MDKLSPSALPGDSGTVSPAVARPPEAGDRVLLGVGLMLAFCAIAPLIDTTSKLAVQEVSIGIVTLGRYVVQAALMLPIVIVLRLPLGLGRRAAGLMLLRACAGVVSTYCFVAAVRVMPLADALAIAFVTPFIILFIARAFLGEEVGPRRLAAAATGFAGALFVIQPSFADFGLVAFLPLGTAFFFAIYMLITRSLSREVHTLTMQLHTAVIATLILLPVLAAGGAAGIGPLVPSLPQGIVWFWLFAMGLAATVSHVMMSYALRFAPSSTLAPLQYLEIVTATLLGYLVFGDFPDPLTWFGIGVIVASGLYVIFRERQILRQARRAPAPDSPAAKAPASAR